jgi:hypothetical protein
MKGLSSQTVEEGTVLAGEERRHPFTNTSKEQELTKETM